MNFNTRRAIPGSMHLADMKSSVPMGKFCSRPVAEMKICRLQHAGTAHVARTPDRVFARIT